jgi:hypothetical protein
MARLSKAGTGKRKIAMTELRKTERRNIAANRRAAKWRIFSTAFAVGDAPSEPINLDQRQRLGAKDFAADPRLGLRAILEEPTHPPPAFLPYSAAILTCLDTRRTVKRTAQMTDGSVSDFHVRFQPRWKVFRNSARSCIISSDTNNLIRPSPSAA